MRRAVRVAVAEPVGPPGPDRATGRRPPPDLRLVPSAVAVWIAAWWSIAASARSGAVAAVLLAATSGGCLGALPRLRLRRRRSVPVPRPVPRPTLVAGLAAAGLALAITAALLSTVAVRVADRNRGPFPGWVADRAVVSAEGQATGDARAVVARPGERPGPPRYVLPTRLDRVTGRGSTLTGARPVLILGGPAWGDLTAGRRLRLTGRLQATDPGDELVALVVAGGGPERVTPGEWWWQLADHLRAGLREACRGLPSDAGGLLPSLVVGDTSRLPARLQADLRTAGLTHLTAVSGANVAIMVVSVLWVCTALGVRRRRRLLLAAVAVLAFVVVARPQPSVLRAATMGLLALAALWVGRRPRGVPLLAATVIGSLFADPWLARSAGFALSCAATAGLLLLAPLWTDLWSRRMPTPVAAALAVPAAAQAVCGPLLVLLQPTLSIAAVPANLLAEPAVAPATMAGVGAALLSPVWPAGAQFAARLGGLATGWIALVAHHAAQLPGAAVPWLPGLLGATVLAALTAAVVLAGLRPPRPPPPPPPAPVSGSGSQQGLGSGPAWRSALPVAGLALLLAVGWALWPRVRLPGLPGLPGGSASWPPRGWTVVQCDVGQGDALVARSGVDRAVLVDVGPDPELVDGCLRRLGVHHLDLVVLTHHHADHVAGLPGALRGRDARQVLVSPLAQPADNAAQVRRWAAAAGVPVSVGADAAGEIDGTGDSAGYRVRWRLFAPRILPVAGSAADEEGTVVNESSLVSEFELGGPPGVLHLVDLGDLETQTSHAETCQAAVR